MFEHHPLPSCKFLHCFCSLSQAGESQAESEVLLSLHDSLGEHRNNYANIDSKEVMVWSTTLVFFSSRTEFLPAHLPHTGLILSGYKNIPPKHNFAQREIKSYSNFQIAVSILSPTEHQGLPREVVDCPSLELSKIPMQNVVVCRFFFSSNLRRPKPYKIMNITKIHGIETEN